MIQRVNLLAKSGILSITESLIIITSQLRSTKSELRFCTGSNPAVGVL